MQIGSIDSLDQVKRQSLHAAAVAAQAKANAAVQTARAADSAHSSKATDTVQPAKQPFSPAPPIRPNVQDYVDIDRALLTLRKP